MRQGNRPGTRETGLAGEAAAAQLLTRSGLRILARNVCCRGGEIDLVALDADTVVFVEVRLRRDGRFGGAAESITATKQARVVRAAQHWLVGAGKAYADSPCRFDVVLMTQASTTHAEWIRNAFDAA